MHLNLEYYFLPHPYSDEPSSAFDQWCAYKLEVVDVEMRPVEIVFDIRWDIIEFVAWFLKNEQMIRTETAPPEIESTSIAKGIFEFYAHLFDGYDFDEDDNPPLDDATEEALNYVNDYYLRHQIARAVRGMTIIDAFIGLHNGQVTLSYYCGIDESNNETKEWSYDIDVEMFFQKVKAIAKLIPRLS